MGLLNQNLKISKTSSLRTNNKWIRILKGKSGTKKKSKEKKERQKNVGELRRKGNEEEEEEDEEEGSGR